MPMQFRPFRLRALSGPARALAAAFILAVAAGMAAAHVNLHLQHAGADGVPGLSYADIVATFHGKPDRTLLAAKIDGGSMARYIPRPVDKEAVLAWSGAGAREADFGPTSEVLARQCLRCHHRAGEMASVPFGESRQAGVRFDLVSAVCVPDPGMSLPSLARSTHAHLFGMGTLFALMGMLVLGTDLRPRAKGVLAVLPFVAMAFDIGGWWLTRFSTLFALSIAAGGALLGLATLAQVARILHELATPEKPAAKRHKPR